MSTHSQFLSRFASRFLPYALLIGLLTGCSEPEQPDTLLIDNIHGYSFNNQRELFNFSAMAIRDGKVLATGDSEIAANYPKAEKFDGQGKTLIPGIIDAHGHVSSLGFTLLSIDVRGLASARQAAEKVANYAAEQPQLQWIKGRGWNQVLWPDQQFPTAALLDQFIDDRPVWLNRVDGHAGWANSAAMKAAGIDKNTLSPAGGEILRDADGIPTGVFIDNAMDLIAQAVPKPTADEITVALDTVSKHLLKLGITSTHDAGVSATEHALYRELADSGAMQVRLYGMISSTDPELEQILAAGHSLGSNDMYSARSIKIYTDGALGSRGAALIEPYQDRPDHSGLLLTSAEQLRQLFSLATKAEFQVAIHAIGDKGNRIALDEIEHAYNTVGGRHLRHRIEHSQVVALSDLPRFKSLDVIPSMQPTHATSDMNMAEDRIGAERLKGAYAWRSFLNQGSRVVSGSDFPVELAAPFDGIHAAVTRQNKANQPEGGWIAEEAMTIKETMRSFSIDAAWAAHQEDRLGGLTPGKWADFILLDQDIYHIAPKDLWKTQVLETWLAGERVFKAK
ncbi:Predicted metal-dependent amidohydrolase with the TIM-barrel fold [gamma proteobacterium HTCC2207]|uniref:Predicted metal-dependent amidohydrolase with the TIM-barrel fold n=1 Tax=gamma proteobacterium HTCC2207 TaxID=314287 RepID=Q1YRP5_9GAMM|nr:Predicted metal-dependent amidohydrolase with the TIM-barrel fold [gamma proteobacterium HTCC2207]